MQPKATRKLAPKPKQAVAPPSTEVVIQFSDDTSSKWEPWNPVAKPVKAVHVIVDANITGLSSGT